MASSNGHSVNNLTSALDACHIETKAVHADDQLAPYADISPAIHVSTTYGYENNENDELIPIMQQESMKNLAPSPKVHYYSRLSTTNMSRLETALSAVMNGHAITYMSGLASFHALLTYLNPKNIVIGDGYHGCHGVIKVIQRLSGLKKVNLQDESSWDAAGVGKGDIIHVETPLNPTGEATNLEYYAELAHKRGAYLTVDATFGPPGLQDPFKHGADVVMHSGTKYIGGHSDMLCGVLAVRAVEMWKGLFMDRYILGSVMGNLEVWLGLRSMRTLELRVQRQSDNAGRLVEWLDSILNGAQATGEESRTVQKTCYRVQHASLQKSEMSWLKKQMPNGFGPVFALWMQTPEMAKRLPSKLHLFHHATSLGGVESLIEWRKMSDDAVDPRLCRISVGVENWEDLRADFTQGFEALLRESK